MCLGISLMVSFFAVPVLTGFVLVLYASVPLPTLVCPLVAVELYLLLWPVLLLGGEGFGARSGCARRRSSLTLKII